MCPCNTAKRTCPSCKYPVTLESSSGKEWLSCTTRNGARTAIMITYGMDRMVDMIRDCQAWNPPYNFYGEIPIGNVAARVAFYDNTVMDCMWECDIDVSDMVVTG